MSVLVKTLQGFSGLGIVSTIPLFLASDNKEQPVRIFRRGGQESQNIKKLLEEKGEEGYAGCVPLGLGGSRSRAVLFICAKTDNLNKPFFYHYDWSLRTRDLKEKLNKVRSLKHQYSYLAQLTLANGTQKNLQTPPLWLSKWGSKEFVPEQHCEITKPTNARNYRLICRVPDSKSQPPAWEQDL